nr:myeloid cell surface antigen CD33-like [Chrysemys picta bellii]
MGRALLPQHDAGERELPPQSPPWRAGGPATLRVLILALLWRGSLSQPLGFTLAVPQSVSVQEGLCVFIPCNFTYPASSDTDNPSAQLYGQWFKEPATVGQDPPVASSVPSAGVSQETQGRFRLTGDPAHGDCSLQISDARRTDAGRYFLYIEKGMLDHTYPSNSDGTAPVLTISVTELTEEPEIQISPARGLPGTLLAGEPVTVTCTAPGRCSGSPPQVTWTGPFNDTARNVSAQLANGTWAHSSELSFTPGQGDNGKELVCTITYSSAQGPSTSRTIRLHISYPTGPPNTTGNLTRNGRLDPTGHPNITGNLTRNGRPDPGTLVTNGSQLMVQEGDSLQFLFSLASLEDPDKLVFIGMGCGLGVALGFFLLGLCVIKRRSRQPAPPSAEAGETANRSKAEHTADEGSLIYSNITSIPTHHKTPATHQTKGIQDRAATAQAPDELHYVSIEFSELQRKRGEPLEAPVMVYAEVRRK